MLDFLIVAEFKDSKIIFVDDLQITKLSCVHLGEKVGDVQILLDAWTGVLKSLRLKRRRNDGQEWR